MSSDPFGKKVPTKRDPNVPSEENLVDELNKDEKQAEIDNKKALTDDIKTLTEIKKGIVGQVLFFLWYWFAALVFVCITYFTYQMGLEREIPKEVIIVIFSTTAIVVGLVGYILKGLFGNK